MNTNVKSLRKISDLSESRTLVPNFNLLNTGPFSERFFCFIGRKTVCYFIFIQVNAENSFKLFEFFFQSHSFIWFWTLLMIFYIDFPFCRARLSQYFHQQWLADFLLSIEIFSKNLAIMTQGNVMITVIIIIIFH